MMSIKVKFCLVILILFAAVTLSAQTDELDLLYKKLSERYSNIETYEASFLQKNYWKEIDTSKQSKGKIYYNASHLLLEYLEPAGQKMLISSEVVTIYDATANQALITNKVDTELRPMAFIALYWDNSTKELLEKDAGNYKLKLITNNNEEIIVSIRDYLITDMMFKDETDNSVTYIFSDEVINKQLPENLFELNLPEDVNIIDYRQ